MVALQSHRIIRVINVHLQGNMKTSSGNLVMLVKTHLDQSGRQTSASRLLMWLSNKPGFDV